MAPTTSLDHDDAVIERAQRIKTEPESAIEPVRAEA